MLDLNQTDIWTCSFKFIDHMVGIHASDGMHTRWGADVPVSAPQTQVAQLEATIRSAHALLQAGFIDEATSLLAAFSSVKAHMMTDTTDNNLHQ